MNNMNILEFDKVFFNYSDSGRDGNYLLENLSLAIPSGEIVSILGPNGSGKTTLLRLFSGYLKPNKGSVLLNQKNINEYSRNEIAKNLAFVSQINDLIFPYSVFQLVAMGRNPYMGNSLFESYEDLDIIDKYLELFELKKLKDKPIDKISGGELQRVYLCRALVQQPKILLMDEPVSHLDIKHQLSSYKILKEMNREIGLTIVLVSHDLNLSMRFSDRLVMIKKGKMVFNSNPNNLTSAELIHETFEVESEIVRSRSGKLYFLMGE